MDNLLSFLTTFTVLFTTGTRSILVYLQF